MKRHGLAKIITAAGLGAVLTGLAVTTSAAATSETYRQLNLFGDVFERVRSDYVTEVEDQQLIEDAINGMLAGLDPHSSYLSPRNYEDMQVQTRGEFGGLGIEVTLEEGVVKVVAPMDGTPAFRAGIKAGDLITHLDGEPIMGMTLNEAIDLMRGAPGTDIVITVYRDGVRDPFDVTITRAVIELRAVRYRAEGDDVGYIRIITFNENTEDTVLSAVRKLERQLGDGLAGFILDLRNNPGGLLDQAIDVADLFLNEGEIVSTRGRYPEDMQRYNARRGDETEGRPIIVLINGGSASASEIVAGALQDQRRAVILGTRSFGKGSVQTVIPLGAKGMNGALRLTTAKYYTPSGRSIQAKGIEPDIELADASQRRPSEADLPGHLPAESGEEKPALKEPEGATPPAEATPRPEANAEDSEPVDVQLQRALDLLRGVKENSAALPQRTARR
ncbi:MAG: S41 family peptidase [Alphaproteobacteria bacterium]